MALICPVCSTENRDGAHFCRHCGGVLPAPADRIPPPPSPEREWATTAPAQLRAPTIPAPLFDAGGPAAAAAPPPARTPARSPARSFFGRASAAPRDDDQTVFMVHDDNGDDGHPSHSPAPRAVSPTFESEHAAKAERGKARASARRPVPLERPPRKRVILLWLGLLGIAVAMLVAGWYGHGTRKTPAAADEAAQPAQPAAPAVPAAAPVAPAAAAEPPAAMSPAAPAETPGAVDTPAAAAASPTAKPAAKPPRKQATVAAPASPAPEPTAPVAAAAPPPPAPAAPAEPQAQCGDRNFIAKAQCMASQCLKPEYRSHAQCDAVRRQQRLEEEKRNPTLAN